MSTGTRKRMSEIKGIAGAGLLGFCMFLVLAILFITLFDIIITGSGSLSLEFLSEFPRKGMTQGGIWPAIFGTVFVTMITAIFAIPLGVAAAIFLSEYARENWISRLIRSTIRNLAGVPSVVYGLFGAALFVQALGFGTSVLASGLTLGLLTLPWIITTSEEAMKRVPRSYREGALALGATKWQSIWHNVLPAAFPGILTGAILGLSRAAGETAPILFTGVAFSYSVIPGSVFDQFMALPYHLYVMSTQHHKLAEVRPMAYGTALVLIAVVLILNMTAFILRYRYRKKLRLN